MFKKDEELITTHHIDPAIETNEIDSLLQTTLAVSSTAATTTKPQTKISSSIISTPTIDIFTIANSDEIISVSQGTKTQSSIEMTTNESEEENYDEVITERIDLEKTVTQYVPVESNVPKSNNDTDSILNEVETGFSTTNIDSPEKEKYGFTDKDESDEFYDSDEDFDIINKNANIKYKHRQKTLPSSTLLHGFIANPGYPSYYIGNDKECKWKVKMASGQKMSLTILDLHLRSNKKFNY